MYQSDIVLRKTLSSICSLIRSFWGLQNVQTDQFIHTNLLYISAIISISKSATSFSWDSESCAMILAITVLLIKYTLYHRQRAEDINPHVGKNGNKSSLPYVSNSQL